MAEPHDNGTRRDVALDALRALAVICMIMSHTTRLIDWDMRRGWSVFSLLIEPMTASMFLILVGASLAFTWNKARAGRRAAWYRKQAIRAGALWVVSCIFYTLEEGFHWPDAVFLSGILATIAYAILFVGALVMLPRSAIWLACAATGLMALHVWMDARGLRVFLVNAGNSPPQPLLLFSCLGALGTMAARGGRAVKIALVTCALLTVAAILSRHSFEAVFSKPLGRYEIARVISSGGGETRVEKTIPYYNLRPILVPMIAAMTVLLYALFALLRPVLERAARLLLPLGRHSLDAYVLHLFLLALLILRWGMRPIHKTVLGDALILGLFVACWLWTLMRDKYTLRRIFRRPAR